MNREEQEKAITARIAPVRLRAAKFAHLPTIISARRLSAEFDVCVYSSRGRIYASFVENEGKEIVRVIQ